MTRASQSSRPSRSTLFAIDAGCLIAIVGFGVRSIFGLVLEPITEARGWERETFALALALQKLLWASGLADVSSTAPAPTS